MKLTNNKLTIDKLQILTVPVGSPIHNIGVDNTGNVVRGTNNTGVTQAQVQQMLQTMYEKCCKKDIINRPFKPYQRPSIQVNNINTHNPNYNASNVKYIPILDNIHRKEYVSMSMYDKLIPKPNGYRSSINLISDERYEYVKGIAKQDGYKNNLIAPLLQFLH